VSGVSSFPVKIRHEIPDDVPLLAIDRMRATPMSFPNVTFAPAKLADIEAIAAMADSISRRHYVPDVLSEAELACFGPLAYAPEVLRAQMQAGVRFEWIVLEGRRVGFLAYAERDDGERLNLGKLYLDPSWHGRGIGQVALRRVQAIARQQGVREVYLYVFRKNRQAIRAYLRAGFIIERAEMTPCDNGFCFDDYLMVYRLDDDKR
jgi:RimJ/RimL family protein N-acetyltransferase